ncbi:MAG: antibiotic biosynthesis monooxygenase family protein [Acidimicrobiales bacterium]
MDHNSPPVSSVVTVINQFEVPVERVDTFIAQWRERAALMSAKPGFLDALLHRAISPRARFQVVNIAHWEDVEAWQTATADLEFRQHSSAVAAHSELVLAASSAAYEVAVELSGSGPSARRVRHVERSATGQSHFADGARRDG